MSALARDDDFGHHTSRRVRFEALHIGASQEFDVGVLQGGIHADHLSVCFAVDQAWKSIERGTSYTGTGVQRLSLGFVKQDAERQRERVMAKPLEIVEQLLNARLVAHGRITIGRAGRAFRRIDPALPVDMIKLFRLCVVGLKVLRSSAARPARCRRGV